MGRYWYWGGSKSWTRGEEGSGGGASDGRAEGDSASTPSGCICAVFQLFNFRQVLLALNQQPSFKSNSIRSHKEDPHIPKVAEAPRNSLELEKPIEGDNLTVPMGIQIKTNGATNDSSSFEISSSPRTKTPNLVARLMGLDILPDDHTYSPRLSCSSNLGATNPDGIESHLDLHFQLRHALQRKAAIHRSSLDSDFMGTRSLPETPRISSATRLDVDHRLSLQINKENMEASEEAMLSRMSSLRRKVLKTEEENRSPGNYARQIVKQVKESISRKVGRDITNTVRNREQRSSREEIVSQFKSKKISKVVDNLSPGKQYTSSNDSPRLKFLESKNKPSTTVPSTDNNISHAIIQNRNHSTNPKVQPIAEDQQQRPMKKCKKGAEGKFSPPTTRLKKHSQTSDIIRNKQEEPFVRATTATRKDVGDKNFKKTPLSNNLLAVKKDPTPPATNIPQKQLSSCSRPSHSQQPVLGAREIFKNNNPNWSNGSGGTGKTGDEEAAAAEYKYYVSRILGLTGIEKDTKVSFTCWFSPSHPLDPAIFHHLELQHFTTPTTNSGQLSQRCNRKLLFHLVDEILVEILRPYINMKPWTTSVRHDYGHNIEGSHLVDMLCSKVKSFPSADCLVLEDIDALIDKDLPHLKFQSELAFEEEGESIVTDIEKDVLDTLIHETARSFSWPHGAIGVVQR